MDVQEHQDYHKRLMYVIVILLLILFGSATFYHYVENWKYIDALYFSAATMTTVGYGDITPKTNGGKIFTIIFVFTGVGIALYGLSLLATHFVEIREEFWLQRIGRIKIRQRTGNVWERLKGLFSYRSEMLLKENEDEVQVKQDDGDIIIMKRKRRKGSKK